MTAQAQKAAEQAVKAAQKVQQLINDPNKIENGVLRLLGNVLDLWKSVI
ncbi:MAG: hypothetical protein F6K42_39545 [Leptolyngbya sp. SIO1D8]|nr:hypothetical protein [Leptolyngbya sp. SIO1D8]